MKQAPLPALYYGPNSRRYGQGEMEDGGSPALLGLGSAAVPYPARPGGLSELHFCDFIPQMPKTPFSGGTGMGQEARLQVWQGPGWLWGGVRPGCTWTPRRGHGHYYTGEDWDTQQDREKGVCTDALSEWNML